MSLAATEEHCHKIESTRDTRWLAIHSHRQSTTVCLCCLAEVSNGSIKSKNWFKRLRCYKVLQQGNKSHFTATCTLPLLCVRLNDLQNQLLMGPKPLETWTSRSPRMKA